MKALDLFCCAGGASYGMSLAGFDITGVDINYQPHYPFEFIQSNIFDLDLSFIKEFDLIWASPPCQRYSELTPKENKQNHPDLIAKTRELLAATKKPYIIENVECARNHLVKPIMLCGSMFDLNIRRHRYFECSFPINPPCKCNHTPNPVVISGRGMRKINGKRWNGNKILEKKEAMQIDWMTGKEITEAIPPAYSKYIAEQFLKYNKLKAIQ